MTIIVGFHGPMFSGKDTACGILVDLVRGSGGLAERRGFADALKVSAARSLGAPTTWTTQECVDFCNDLKGSGQIHLVFEREEAHPEIPGNPTETFLDAIRPPISGREYLQWYGTEAHREVFGEDFWVDALLPQPDPEGSAWTAQEKREDIMASYEYGPLDVLAVSDVRFESEADRILRLGGHIVRLVRPGTGEGDAHASERPLPEAYVTHTINNGGEIKDLEEAVVAFARLESLI